MFDLVRNELDRLCDDFALAGMFDGRMFRVQWPADPWLRWIAELGMREGQWLKAKRSNTN